MRTHHYQHRQNPGLSEPDGYPHFREPQVALDLVPGFVVDPVRGIGRVVLRPDPGHVLPEPRRRSGPAHTLGQNRRRHPRVHPQQRPDRRFHRLDPGVLRCTDIGRRAIRTDRFRNGVPGNTQPRCYRPHRLTLGKMQPPNKRPILHCDHPPNRLEQVAHFSTVTTAQFSTITDRNRQHNPAQAQPLRRPATQPGLRCHRPLPHELRHRNQGLCNRKIKPRDPPEPQTLRLPLHLPPTPNHHGLTQPIEGHFGLMSLAK